MEQKKRNKIKTQTQKVPRHKEKFAALNPKRAVKNRQEQLDVPYLDKLNDKEKAWLNNFLEESVITNFQHKGKKFYTSKKAKRKLYSENNARNRCVYTKAKSMGTLIQMPLAGTMTGVIDSAGGIVTPSEQEDFLLTLIELKDQGLDPNKT